MLGSQGIVVKCTAAIFFPTADCAELKDDKVVKKFKGMYIASRVPALAYFQEIYAERKTGPYFGVLLF